MIYPYDKTVFGYPFLRIEIVCTLLYFEGRKSVLYYKGVHLYIVSVKFGLFQNSVGPSLLWRR